MKKSLFFFFLFLFPFSLIAQQSKIDSVVSIVNLHTKDSIEVRALNWLAIDAEKKDTPTAIRYYHQAIQVSEKYGDGRATITSFARLALLLSSAGMNDSAQFYLDKAKHVLDRLPASNKFWYTYYNALGVLNKNSGNSERALASYEHILALGEAVIGKDNLAGNYLNMANIYNKNGKVLVAQEFLFKALKIFEGLKNETGISFCYNGLGIQFYSQKNYLKAEDYLKKSLALKIKIGNKKTIATGYNGLAVLYMDMKDYPKALGNIDLAISLSKEFNMKNHLCEGLINKGMIYHLYQKLPEALTFFTEAKTLAEEIQNAGYLAKVNVELGDLYKEQSKQEQAITSLVQAIGQAQQGKNLDFEQSAHHHLADVYYNNRQYKEAFEEYRLYHKLYDSLEGSTVKMQLYDQEARYETQKKEAEIALLKKDQQLQTAVLKQQQLIQLTTLLALVLVAVISVLFFIWYRIVNRTRRKLEIEQVRNHIAQDLHDDIGSTLSSIRIISTMAARNGAGEKENANFQLIENYSGKMLSTMTDIIWSINPKNDEVGSIMVHMKEFAAEILEPQNIAYHFKEKGKLEHLKMNVLARKNFFLIYKEVLNNAAKYSGCTDVYIELIFLEGVLTLSLRDNGHGFNNEAVKHGNGLKNMRDRATLMKGKFELKTGEGQGTEITVSAAIT